MNHRLAPPSERAWRSGLPKAVDVSYVCYLNFIQLATSGEAAEMGNGEVWSVAVSPWNSNLNLSSLSSPSLLIPVPILILLQLCKESWDINIYVLLGYCVW